jgi:hypothetical protein
MPPFSHDFNDFATQMSINPMHYLSVVGLGDPEANPIPANNGTVSLLLLNGKKLGITCAHVITTYQRQVDQNIGVILQVGRAHITLDRVVDIDVGLDLAVIDLEGVDVSGMNVPARFFEPPIWPPTDVHADDLISMSGLPGLSRVVSGTRTDYRTFSACLVPVHRVEDGRIIIQLNREELVFRTGLPEEDLPQCLGGVSGGPVFLNRITPAGILINELVGIISEQSPPYDIFYAQRINCIREDGRISR